MLHVYHYLTNIINQTVLPLYKKAGGNDFLRLLPIVCYWYLFRLTNEIYNMLDLLTHRNLILDH